MRLLRTHIYSNFVRLNGQFFHQVDGIPQGNTPMLAVKLFLRHAPTISVPLFRVRALRLAVLRLLRIPGAKGAFPRTQPLLCRFLIASSTNAQRPSSIFLVLDLVVVPHGAVGISRRIEAYHPTKKKKTSFGAAAEADRRFSVRLLFFFFAAFNCFFTP